MLGVVPPGGQTGGGPGPGPKRKRQGASPARVLAAARRGEELPPLDLGRPMAGFVPQVFADAGDPDGLEPLLSEISRFLTEHRPPPERAESFSSLLFQSRAPFELVLGFTLLSVLVGSRQDLRRRYGLALERGAKAFFNLARRLDPGAKIPRGLNPETLDPLFLDLPDIALQVPFAFVADAFCRQIDLLFEAEPARDRLLVEEALSLRRRFIERRAYGDRALRDLFPLTLPDWAERFELDG